MGEQRSLVGGAGRRGDPTEECCGSEPEVVAWQAKLALADDPVEDRTGVIESAAGDESRRQDRQAREDARLFRSRCLKRAGDLSRPTLLVPEREHLEDEGPFGVTLLEPRS